MPIFSFIGAQNAAAAQERAGQLQADAAREGVELNRQIANFGIADTSAGRAGRDVAFANLLARQGLEIPDVRLSNPEAQIGRVSGFDSSGNAIGGGTTGEAGTSGGELQAFDPSGRRLSDIGITPFELSPAARFRQEEGNRAVQSSAAARGLLGSGGTLRDLSKFNQGLASQEFDADFNRLSLIAGFGANEGAAGRKTASDFGNLGAQGLSAAASSQAQGITNAANTRATAFGNLGQSIVGIAGGF
ncbi:MAG: hypothetical protein COA78_21925 [Blastopirellula sp.]|nr:MAG: hypothetical protein COA78_21925 [Blastopirellula sp.]